jgi:hypothetical protein
MLSVGLWRIRKTTGWSARKMKGFLARLVRPEHRRMILSSPDPAGLLEQFAAYQPPQVPKRIFPLQTE